MSYFSQSLHRPFVTFPLCPQERQWLRDASLSKPQSPSLAGLSRLSRVCVAPHLQTSVIPSHNIRQLACCHFYYSTTSINICSINQYLRLSEHPSTPCSKSCVVDRFCFYHNRFIFHLSHPPQLEDYTWGDLMWNFDLKIGSGLVRQYGRLGIQWLS